MSPIRPRSGSKQTSGERVEDDANDPQRRAPGSWQRIGGESPVAAGKAANLVGERPMPSIARSRTASISDGRDQLTLVCSVGDRPARAKVRSLVVWMAGWRERKFSEVLKAHRQGLPWGDHESPGRNNSKRKCSLENARSEGRAHHRRAKVAWDAEI